MAKKQIITKLDAARRQLETAVRIYFALGDAVSMHTLGSASRQILLDYARAKKLNHCDIEEIMVRFIVPDKQKKFRALMRNTANFLKHADKDYKDVLAHNIDQTDFILMEACSTYHCITGEDVALFSAFMTWQKMRRPEIFEFPPEATNAATRLSELYGEHDRSLFLEDMLQINERQKSAALKNE